MTRLVPAPAVASPVLDLNKKFADYTKSAGIIAGAHGRQLGEEFVKQLKELYTDEDELADFAKSFLVNLVCKIQHSGIETDTHFSSWGAKRKRHAQALLRDLCVLLAASADDFPNDVFVRVITEYDLSIGGVLKGSPPPPRAVKCRTFLNDARAGTRDWNACIRWVIASEMIDMKVDLPGLDKAGWAVPTS